MGNWLGFPEDPQPGDHVLDGNGTRHGVNSSISRPAIESMAVHVKEVLPQVPIDVIRKDLTVTTNVDETITRLLDGTVTYQPERRPSPSATASTSIRSSNGTSAASSSQSSFAAPLLTHPPLITAASSFGKSADERHASFEERKQKLIQESKRRYLARQEFLKQHNAGNEGATASATQT